MREIEGREDALSVRQVRCLVHIVDDDSPLALMSFRTTGTTSPIILNVRRSHESEDTDILVAQIRSDSLCSRLEVRGVIPS